jgi:hypothetical protein
VRLLSRVLILLCCSGNLLDVFGQSTTIRSGFAVVTVISGNVAGLVATETLMNTLTEENIQDIVGPSPIVTSASVLVNVGSGTESAIAFANPSDASGGVNLLLTDRQGGVVLRTAVHLNPQGHVAKFVNQFFGADPPEFSSPLLLTLSSEIPVAVLAFNFRGADFASIPITPLNFPTTFPLPPLSPVPTAPTITTIGINTLFFAQVATGGDWSTLISLGNTLDGSQIVQIDFFGSDGFSLGSVGNIVIPAHGLVTFSSESLITAIR